MNSFYRTTLLVISFISTIACTLFASHIPPLWIPFTVSAIVLAFSLLMNRRLLREEIEQSEAVDNPILMLDELIKTLLLDMDVWQGLENNEDKTAKINQKVTHIYNAIEQIRPALLEVVGIRIYAELFSMFSIGDRQLNRALSAAMDGYWQEASENLRQSAESFKNFQSNLTINEGI